MSLPFNAMTFREKGRENAQISELSEGGKSREETVDRMMNGMPRYGFEMQKFEGVSGRRRQYIGG